MIRSCALDFGELMQMQQLERMKSIKLNLNFVQFLHISGMSVEILIRMMSSLKLGTNHAANCGQSKILLSIQY